MSESRKIGDIIDGLGVTAELASSDMVASAVVILRVVEEDGTPGFVIARDESASWMDEFTLIKLANREIDRNETIQRDIDG